MPVLQKGMGRYGTARKFTGQLWENGEFGFSVQKSFTVAFPLRSARGEGKEWSLYRPVLSDLRETVHSGAKGSYERIDLCLETRQSAPLQLSNETFEHMGLSLLTNSHTRAKRGSKGISPYASKLVRNACYRLEKDYGRDRVSFLTLTLPPTSQESLARIIANWGNIIRTFHQWLRRRLLSAGLPPHIVGVTEIQSNRFRRSGFVGYHLHFAFVGRQYRSRWAVSPHEFQAAWKRSVSPHLAHPESVQSWNASSRVERVLYSLEGYLGKYLTKGASEVGAVIRECGEEFLVSSWHSISKELKDKVLSKRVRGNQEVFEFIAELCESELNEIFIYRRKVYIEDGDIKIPWGWAGKLTEWGMTIIRDWMSTKSL